MVKFFRVRFYIAVTLLISILSIGILGYRILGSYTWLDAVYMTIITITTVGFREVNPVDHTMKIFTIFLIISSVFIVAFAISIITEYLISRNSLQNLKYKRMEKLVKALDNHVIICGYGRNGMQAAMKLKNYRRDFVVIEKDIHVIEKYENEILFLEGDANEDETLIKAGINKAECLISALPDDAANLFVVLSSRQLNEKLTIISRASQETSQRKLLLAGADRTIMPDKIGGDHMASFVVLPDLTEFLDHLSFDNKTKTNIEEIAIDNLPEAYQNKTIIDLDLRKLTGCNVIGYRKPTGEYIINPDSDNKLVPHSKLIVLGRPEQISKLHHLFKF
ncbi:potassium channel family protein [Zhouia sp. PK063]|uniref:potassium channel family protein n=1 Tax=Zhouia sp. PK063 TaxID=3373602 RepID=UPI00379FA599